MQVLILAGGSGTRFWPLSRRHRPKQLLALDGETSLLRRTVDRLAPRVKAVDVWVCTTEALAAATRAELPEVPAAQILVEPEGRNTAPAIGWSLSVMPEVARQGVVAVLAADHRVADEAAFRRVLDQAAEVVARDDRVMTLGVRPYRPETGYGYLELGAELAGTPGLRAVARFTEKPDAATAERWAEGGRHLWNAGIFVFRGTTLLAHLERLEPRIGEILRAIRAAPERTAELYPTLPSISIDYAVAERLDDLATLPLDCGWSDVGSWQAVAELDAGRDAAANRCHGDVLTHDAHRNLLWADEGTIAAIGVEGLVVVRTGDAVLVMPRERSQEVRAIVDELTRRGRDELL